MRIYCAILKFQRNEYAKRIRKAYEAHEMQERRCNMKEVVPRADGLCNTITTVQKDNYLLEAWDEETDSDKLRMDGKAKGD